ncbi:hypothetical protein FGSG_03019 [Fusarium graminearum PH-1]|uniref:hypothetical protein n=1 Tax=Gibberella zeae (strain ATCC MYA-4620 / CBS 123657 / FGSC 9075 / NRRL 31084 / PH-1) TaxID=229533 RepID=UPI00021F19BF|nr:hypothetical protein FGSG_03019 [Fusarium graminearum PH-1]ESU10269.1 hypothetical protein FGSG_03019 [Fusarium graminearum PH-1]|eukprot:XP_011322768.1 hypothetical protein FGSG_03019 [Fusarium graminearum PH-1]
MKNPSCSQDTFYSRIEPASPSLVSREPSPELRIPTNQRQVEIQRRTQSHKSHKRQGGLRLAAVNGDVPVEGDVDNANPRQMQVGQENFPKRVKVKHDGVFHPKESSLGKFVAGVWEQIHSGVILEPHVLTEQVQLTSRSSGNSPSGDLVSTAPSIRPDQTWESFNRSNIFCQRVTQASRTCRSIEVIVQARWVELFDSYVEYLASTNPNLSMTKCRMRAIAEACTDFGWTEKELRNKMGIWRGYKEIKDVLGWVALVFSGMGLYRLYTALWGADDPRWTPPSSAICLSGINVCDLCSEVQSNESAVNACKCFPNLFGVPRLPIAVQVFCTSNGRNNGLQALVAFERGTAIGEFVGLITKDIEEQDVMDSQAGGTRYQIWQGKQGNFTRKIPLASYLFTRLKQAGTRRIYGVPGDFTLRALDHVPRSGIQFVGCCNELNAGYAADGYARAQRHRLQSGLGALITTYGVGELSAANAVAGSYAEHLPVVHIVGTPSQKARQVSTTSVGGRSPHLHIHHTLADSRIGVFREIAEKFTVAQLDLSGVDAEDVPTKVDEVLAKALYHSRPVYVELPSDAVETVVSSTLLERPIEERHTINDESSHLETREMADSLLQRLYAAKRPLILVDRGDGIETIRPDINEFVQKSGIPTLSLPSGASMVNNSLPNYFGVYSGSIGIVDLTSAVKSADLVLAFGCQFSDTQTLGWGVVPERNSMIMIGRNNIEDHQTGTGEILRMVTANLDKRSLAEQDTSSWGNFRHLPSQTVEPASPINQDEFYIHLNKYLKDDDNILLGNATPIIGGRDFVLPPSSQLIASGMWFSIGHMLPAAMGVSQAKADQGSSGRTILLDGDGSFQMTAQELSTIIHKRVNMVVFIINNSGYTYERYIHGMDEEYNDVAPWNYSLGPNLFGQAPDGYPIQSCRVHTWKELDSVLNSEGFSTGKGLTLVDIVIDKYDISERAKALFELVNKQL